MNRDYDVIVLGGGTAGIIAVIQAARAGASTLLIEKNGMLGGTMTIGGVNFPAHFFTETRHVIRGIGWELVSKTYETAGLPAPADDQGIRHIRVDAALFAAIADEAVLNSGADLLFHAMPASVLFADNHWSVQVCTKTGLTPFRAKVLVDATGDANIVSLAGFELNRTETVQPATLSFGCSGYDAETLDYAALSAAAKVAVSTGELLSTDLSWRNDGPKELLKKHGHNSNHVRAPMAESSEGRSMAEIEGRRSLLRAYSFLKKQPGLEQFRIDWVCPEIGIRETVTIKGKTSISTEDYENGKLFEDAICYAFYPIDEHLNDGNGILFRALGDGVLPTIPRGALLPAGSRSLIVAGRCLASDREANSALRVECPCMAMGQAAGAMAALSARSGVDPEDLPMDEVYRLLREHDAIIPGDLPSAQ